MEGINQRQNPPPPLIQPAIEIDGDNGALVIGDNVVVVLAVLAAQHESHDALLVQRRGRQPRLQLVLQLAHDARRPLRRVFGKKLVLERRAGHRLGHEVRQDVGRSTQLKLQQQQLAERRTFAKHEQVQPLDSHFNKRHFREQLEVVVPSPFPADPSTVDSDHRVVSAFKAPPRRVRSPLNMQQLLHDTGTQAPRFARQHPSHLHAWRVRTAFQAVPKSAQKCTLALPNDFDGRLGAAVLICRKEWSDMPAAKL